MWLVLGDVITANQKVASTGHWCYTYFFIHTGCENQPSICKYACAVTVPSEFLAVQRYHPSSEGCTPVMRRDPGDGSSLRLPGNCAAILLQEITGVGTPVALQWNVTLVPSTAVWFRGLVVNTGGDAGSRKNGNINYWNFVKRIYISIHWFVLARLWRADALFANTGSGRAWNEWQDKLLDFVKRM